MRTFELLIVFAALMAVIALVAIAIDWVGRPLRNRRFIPRIYRYDDEVNPDAAFSPVPAAAAMAVAPAVAPPVAGPPVAMQPPVVATVAAELAPRPPDANAPSTPHPDRASSTTSATTRSAFSDSLDGQVPGPGRDDKALDGVDGTGSLGGARPRGIAETIPVAAADSWHPGMALDARVAERKATVAVKAERFWKAGAASLISASHFDDTDKQRMAEGKAPRRRNPRTGDLESMELIGLRSASDHGDVRMKWPDDTVDPWNAS